MGSETRDWENEGSGVFGFVLPLYGREAKDTSGKRKRLATAGEGPAPGTKAELRGL